MRDRQQSEFSHPMLRADVRRSCTCPKRGTTPSWRCPRERRCRDRPRHRCHSDVRGSLRFLRDGLRSIMSRGGELHALLRELILVACQLGLIRLGARERRDEVVGRRQPRERRRANCARALPNGMLREERGDFLELFEILSHVGHGWLRFFCARSGWRIS